MKRKFIIEVSCNPTVHPDNLAKRLEAYLLNMSHDGYYFDFQTIKVKYQKINK